MRNNESAIVIDEQRDNSLENTACEMHDLVNRIRCTVARRVDWEQTARLVADELKGNLPSPDILTFQQRLGDPDHYCSLPLHIEPNGSFSIVALVWRPGQETPIHDHVAWCVFGVIQGVEYEELYLKDDGGCLIEAGVNCNPTGTVSHVVPPGDIHRVRSAGDSIAISIHIYGTDVRRVGSSVRREYEPPVPATDVISLN
jgi:3-mercaptopropionate dioxygenase